MKIEIKVLVPDKEETQPLSVEVEGDVVTVCLGGKEIFGTDYSANFEEFIIGILKLWSTKPFYVGESMEGTK